MSTRQLMTRRGPIRFPAYIPVTTFGRKYPLDDLVRPYLPRLAPAMMVSYHYARQMTGEPPRLPVMVDSGGFASLFENARLKQRGRLGLLEIKTDEGVETISPQQVLELQERVADVAFTLDFPIPPNMERKAAERRQRLTIANAHWALANRRRQDLPLYACVQAWDVPSARACAHAYADAGFDGIAIGGLVPRAQNIRGVLGVVAAVRDEIGAMPLHVFGLGKPETVQALFQEGVDSVDSSSYVKLAAEGRRWDSIAADTDLPPTERLNLALFNLAMATGQFMPLSSYLLATKAVSAPAHKARQRPTRSG